MSSKGQVVIPASMRTDLPEGEKILIIWQGERIIPKPLTNIEPALRDDILFAEKTEKAFGEYSKGTFIKKNAGDFIEEMDSWGPLLTTRTLKRLSGRSAIPGSRST